MLEHPARFQRLAEDFLTLPDPSRRARVLPCGDIPSNPVPSG
jgi:hypothetical protein